MSQLMILVLSIIASVMAPVYSQKTYPYISTMGETLVNNSFVDIFSIGSSDADALQCITDLPTCCTGSQGPHRGDWYFPEGNRVSFSGDIYESRSAHRVDLKRTNNAISPTGIYRCDIPTINVFSSTDTSLRETVYVGIYSGAGGDIGQVSITRSNNTFTCISTGGPATTVILSRDSIILVVETHVTVLNNVDTAQYTHTLTLSESPVNGVYTCTVSNNKPSAASANIVIDESTGGAGIILDPITTTGSTWLYISWRSESSQNTVIWRREADCPFSSNVTGQVNVSSSINTYNNITGLERGTRYTVEVRAVSFAGGTATTKEEVPSATPTLLNVTAVTSSTLTIEWDLVECQYHNGLLIGYSVLYGVVGNIGMSSVIVRGRDVNQTTISGLASSTKFWFQVAAINSAGAGNYSDLVDQETNAVAVAVDDEPVCNGIECGLSAEAVVGISIATVVVLLLVVVCGLVSCILFKQRKRFAPPPFPDSPQPKRISGSLHQLYTSAPSQPFGHYETKEIEDELRRKNMLFPKCYLKLGQVVGQGESGLVYRGYIHNNAELVAIKTGKALSSEGERERLMKEVSIMINFHHPNVMSLIGLSLDGETPLLIMPFMTKGNVLSYLRQNREIIYTLDTNDLAKIEAARKNCLGICHQISKGMSYLATVKYVHRDLAARNCMIDDGGIIKVSDFGLTEDMYTKNYYRQEVSETGREEKLPLKWMAPESSETHVFNEKSDVWSFGVTCWEVFTSGGVPYSGVPVTTLLGELRSGHRLDRPSNAACSDDIWSVITSCWAANPNDRPTFAELVNTLTDLFDTDPNYIKLITTGL